MLPHNERASSNSVQGPVLLPSSDPVSPPCTDIDDWRDLAQQIQKETDSSKIVNMVQQLIAKLDEQNARIPRPDAK
jgi:hypothetical protein